MSLMRVELDVFNNTTSPLCHTLESSRRKSSKPRKVVPSDTGTIESDGTNIGLDRTADGTTTIESADNGYGRLNFAASRLGSVPLSVIE